MTKGNGIAFAVILSGGTVGKPSVKVFYDGTAATSYAADLSEKIEEGTVKVVNARVDFQTVVIK